MKEVIFTAKIGLEGLTPLLHHACNGLGEKVATNATTDYSEEWKTTTYINSDGFLVVPERCLSACFREAARGTKIGKLTMPRVISSGIQIEEFEVEIHYPGKTGDKLTIEEMEKENYLFSCPVVVKLNRVLRTRAAVPIGWHLDFTLQVTNPLLKPDILRDLIDNAGYMCGLLDNRPNAPKKPGKFGQFKLDYFNVI